ncbi:NLI interacting factor-like phosphatase, putative [Plasmodium ovale]|uniref:protein-serine/threonine phosphatase n=2 Tax=Plasmodium ovale TaxID=36330 RepID=A0A1A8WNL3_PLAOA|nr:NLI interacting factor-like phosphatase, putative [Plasmodium ovale curtisi]SCP04938.1 NLI interacting factor-like phosphatase, putative [Plasmodium ovale]
MDEKEGSNVVETDPFIPPLEDNRKDYDDTYVGNDTSVIGGGGQNERGLNDPGKANASSHDYGRDNKLGGDVDNFSNAYAKSSDVNTTGSCNNAVGGARSHAYGKNVYASNNMSTFYSYQENYCDNVDTNHVKSKMFNKRSNKITNTVNYSRGNHNNFSVNKNFKNFRSKFNQFNNKGGMKLGSSKQNISREGDHQSGSSVIASGRIADESRNNQQGNTGIGQNFQTGEGEENSDNNGSSDCAEDGRCSSLGQFSSLSQHHQYGQHHERADQAGVDNSIDTYYEGFSKSGNPAQGKFSFRGVYESGNINNGGNRMHIGSNENGTGDGKDSASARDASGVISGMSGIRSIGKFTYFIGPGHAQNVYCSMDNDTVLHGGKNTNDEKKEAEGETVSNTHKIVDRCNSTLKNNSSMRRNEKSTGNTKKRKTIKFDTNSFYKHKQKKNYNKSFNDSLKRYSNNTLKLVSGKKKDGFSIYSNSERHKSQSFESKVSNQGNSQGGEQDDVAGGDIGATASGDIGIFYHQINNKTFNNVTPALNNNQNPYAYADGLRNRVGNAGGVSFGSLHSGYSDNNSLYDRDKQVGRDECDVGASSHIGQLSDLHLMAANLNSELLKNLGKGLQKEVGSNIEVDSKGNYTTARGNYSKLYSNNHSYIECLSEVSEISDDEQEDDKDTWEENRNKPGDSNMSNVMNFCSFGFDAGGESIMSNVGTGANHAISPDHHSVSSSLLDNSPSVGNLDRSKSDLMRTLYNLYKNADTQNIHAKVQGVEIDAAVSAYPVEGSSNNIFHIADSVNSRAFYTPTPGNGVVGMDGSVVREENEANAGSNGSGSCSGSGSGSGSGSALLRERENQAEKSVEHKEHHIRNEDLYINTYMPYPPEKYNNIYELHEIKILSPYILKNILCKEGKGYHSSLKDGKLILLLDLDNTLLQATSFAKFSMELPLENFVDEYGEPELYKFFLPYYNFFYYLKFRPYVRQFLEILSLYYELSIYTNATREYADVVIAILDPDRTLFGDRIVARCSSSDRDENKNFSKIYPNVDSKYVIAFDDRKDVWTDIPHSHILRAEHYNFFELSKYDIISHFKEPKNSKKKFVDMDMHLHYMTKVFLKIHKNFFQNPLKVDVGNIIDDIMMNTLRNVGVYFTGFRKNSKNIQNVLSSDCEDRQKEIALELGAKIYSNYDLPGVTHIIAAKNCTDNLIKSKKADYNHIKKVHTLWLYHCRGTLESGNSSFFDADELCKIYNNKPPLHPKKDHWFFGNKDDLRKNDDTSECVKVENLKSRIFLGTGEYTNDAVICSPFEQINIKWIEKEVKLRQIYDTPLDTTPSVPGDSSEKKTLLERNTQLVGIFQPGGSALSGEYFDIDENFTHEENNVEGTNEYTSTINKLL